MLPRDRCLLGQGSVLVCDARGHGFTFSRGRNNLNSFSNRSESSGGHRSAIKMPAAKFSYVTCVGFRGIINASRLTRFRLNKLLLQVKSYS